MGFIWYLERVCIIGIGACTRGPLAKLPAGTVELSSSTVDAPISLHNVSAIPMDMRPNDAALAAAAAEPPTQLSHEAGTP